MAKVIIDIGHGINTRGKGVGSHKEHAFNSKLGSAIKRILESNGLTVIFGQQPFSEDLPLRHRTNNYNASGADICVSIHANASGNPDVNGRCVFYWHSDKGGERLATLIRDNIEQAGYSTHGNGLHEGSLGNWTNLHMIREPKMPRVLIEHGFMTGNKDFDLIFGNQQETYIKDMALADSKAILSYLGKSYAKPKEEVKVVMINDLYRVQVGAFSNKENAEKLAAELKAKGYPVFIPDADTTSASVSVNSSKPVKPQETIDQLAQEVIDGDTPPQNITKIAVDGSWGQATTKRLQQVLGTQVTGLIGGQARHAVTNDIPSVKFGSGGSMVVKEMQRRLGVKVDGSFGPGTLRALQKRMGTPITGAISRTNSSVVKKLQHQLNQNKF